jgi:RecB family exonuclease
MDMGTQVGEIRLWECEDSPSQVHAVVERVAEALAAGKNPETLRVVNATSEDKTRMALEAWMYGFRFDEDRSVPLSRFPRILGFLRRLEHERLEDLLSNYSPSSEEIDLRCDGALLSIINRYGISVLSEDPDLLKHEIKKTTLFFPAAAGSVQWMSADDMVPDSDIEYFWMNFTDDSVPRLDIDVDFLSDIQKNRLRIPTSIQINAWRRDETVRLLDSIPNLSLYYPKKGENRTNKPPRFPVKRVIVASDYQLLARPLSRSREYDRLLYAKRRYEWERFGRRSEDFGLLKKTFPVCEKFDPQFRGLRSDQVETLLSRGVSLSPTSLGCFYQCRFRFFLQNLLKIKPRENALEMSLGNLAHYVLSLALSGTRSVEEAAREYIHKDEFLATDPTASWLAMRFSERLERVVAELKERRSQSLFHDFSIETVYSYLLPDHPFFRVVGKIDLIRTFSDASGIFAAIIDYKTGNPVFREEAFQKALDLQLVFYLHLLSRSGTIPGMIPAGFYYQPVNLGKILRGKKDPIKEKLKMNGLTLKSIRVAQALDPTGDIRGLRRKADGDFYADAKVIDLETMRSYLLRMEKLITSAVAAIEKGDFAITPIPVSVEETESESCIHCPFQGICYLANSLDETEEEPQAEGDDPDALDD